jgi:hypothetical protein
VGSLQRAPRAPLALADERQHVAFGQALVLLVEAVLEQPHAPPPVAQERHRPLALRRLDRPHAARRPRRPGRCLAAREAPAPAQQRPPLAHDCPV